MIKGMLSSAIPGKCWVGISIQREASIAAPSPIQSAVALPRRPRPNSIIRSLERDYTPGSTSHQTLPFVNHPTFYMSWVLLHRPRI